MATLKLVTVLIGVFTKEKHGPTLRDYIQECIAIGSVSTLFLNPAITTAFYAAGTVAYGALALAITNYSNNITTENLKIVKAKMALVVVWLRSYAAQVQVIANLPINCTTRLEASNNILASYLTPAKLISTRKGNPDAPLFNAKFVDGIIVVNITNGKTYHPASITIIAVAVPPVTVPATPNPTVTLVQSTATVSIVSKVGVHTISKSFSGKGTSGKIAGATLSASYNLVAYAQNGNKQCSLLSAPVLVTIITPSV